MGPGDYFPVLISFYAVIALRCEIRPHDELTLCSNQGPWPHGKVLKKWTRTTVGRKLG